ncbi:MAG: hypothetical protein IIY84_01375, partial [Eubacterium sp.]|nr:hypothetical protein [Eubacterium sp.]
LILKPIFPERSFLSGQGGNESGKDIPVRSRASTTDYHRFASLSPFHQISTQAVAAGVLVMHGFSSILIEKAHLR